MSGKLLIIEDEAAIQSILSELLTDAGYTVEVAGDGLEGITKFREQSFSLVLLDIMMPKIDGYTVCEMIRRESKTPIIMLTALDEEEAQVKAFELKVDDYITKPFGMMETVSRIKAVLRRTGKPKAQDIYTYKTICLNSRSHVVTVNGATVELTFKEFELLKYLLQNEGTVLTRDMLLEKIWGYDFDGETRTADVHIRTLRAKLGDAGQYIETVRGVGYRIGGAQND